MLGIGYWKSGTAFCILNSYFSILPMNPLQSSFQYQSYGDIGELNESDAFLLQKARSVTAHAHAPYSNFRVGAAVRLASGEIVTGSNQENASFPLGLCAERVAMATVSSLYPGIAVDAIAVSYENGNGSSDHPVSPCGICRQVLAEYEEKLHYPIRLILSGMSGEVLVISSVKLLLPLSFSAGDIHKQAEEDT